MRMSLPSVKKSLVLVVLVTAILLPRVFQLGQFLTADEKRWQANVSGFTTKLSQGRLAELVQQPHPGITTQWFAAATVFQTDWALKKIPLVLWQCVLLGIIGYVFWRLSGGMAASLVTLLLAQSPILIAHTRIYAMDSLLSEFCLLSLGLLLLWQKTSERRYLFFAGFTAAAALLSKLPAVILIPLTPLYVMWWRGIEKKTANYFLVWVIGYAIGLCLILPSFLINPSSVIGDFLEFFRSNEYSGAHQNARFYYVSTLAFFMTPVEMAALAVLTVALIRKRPFPYEREMGLFIVFALTFFIMMSLGLKKGDRYILPVFLAIDVITSYVLLWLIQNYKQIRPARIALGIFAFLFVWQVIDVAQLNTYVLAYVNPITKPFLKNRRLGWGEGLDLAAHYLNQKPNGKTLTAASYYPVEFSYRLDGDVKPVHNWNSESVDYVVLYRAMLERGQDSWEQDVLDHFKNKRPEKTISLGGVEYVWIYKAK